MQGSENSSSKFIKLPEEILKMMNKQVKIEPVNSIEDLDNLADNSSIDTKDISYQKKYINNIIIKLKELKNKQIEDTKELCKRKFNAKNMYLSNRTMILAKNWEAITTDVHGDLFSMLSAYILTGLVTVKENEFIYFNKEKCEFSLTVENDLNPNIIVLPMLHITEVDSAYFCIYYGSGRLVNLGNYVDGPESYACVLISYLLKKSGLNITNLIGNCEVMEKDENIKKFIYEGIKEDVFNTCEIIKAGNSWRAYSNVVLCKRHLIKIFKQLKKLLIKELPKNKELRVDWEREYKKLDSNLQSKLMKIIKECEIDEAKEEAFYLELKLRDFKDYEFFQLKNAIGNTYFRFYNRFYQEKNKKLKENIDGETIDWIFEERYMPKSNELFDDITQFVGNNPADFISKVGNIIYLNTARSFAYRSNESRGTVYISNIKTDKIIIYDPILERPIKQDSKVYFGEKTHIEIDNSTNYERKYENIKLEKHELVHNKIYDAKKFKSIKNISTALIISGDGRYTDDDLREFSRPGNKLKEVVLLIKKVGFKGPVNISTLYYFCEEAFFDTIEEDFLRLILRDGIEGSLDNKTLFEIIRKFNGNCLPLDILGTLLKNGFKGKMNIENIIYFAQYGERTIPGKYINLMVENGLYWENRNGRIICDFLFKFIKACKPGELSLNSIYNIYKLLEIIKPDFIFDKCEKEAARIILNALNVTFYFKKILLNKIKIMQNKEEKADKQISLKSLIEKIKESEAEVRCCEEEFFKTKIHLAKMRAQNKKWTNEEFLNVLKNKNINLNFLNVEFTVSEKNININISDCDEISNITSLMGYIFEKFPGTESSLFNFNIDYNKAIKHFDLIKENEYFDTVEVIFWFKILFFLFKEKSDKRKIIADKLNFLMDNWQVEQIAEDNFFDEMLNVIGKNASVSWFKFIKCVTGSYIGIDIALKMFACYKNDVMTIKGFTKRFVTHASFINKEMKLDKLIDLTENIFRIMKPGELLLNHGIYFNLIYYIDVWWRKSLTDKTDEYKKKARDILESRYKEPETYNHYIQKFQEYVCVVLDNYLYYPEFGYRYFNIVELLLTMLSTLLHFAKRENSCFLKFYATLQNYHILSILFDYYHGISFCSRRLKEIHQHEVENKLRIYKEKLKKIKEDFEKERKEVITNLKESYQESENEKLDNLRMRFVNIKSKYVKIVKNLLYDSKETELEI